MSESSTTFRYALGKVVSELYISGALTEGNKKAERKRQTESTRPKRIQLKGILEL